MGVGQQHTKVNPFPYHCTLELLADREKRFVIHPHDISKLRRTHHLHLEHGLILAFFYCEILSRRHLKAAKRPTTFKVELCEGANAAAPGYDRLGCRHPWQAPLTGRRKTVFHFLRR